MSLSDVDRISIQHDDNWETCFISWLEDKQERNVGTESGAFVATLDSAIRTVQPHSEEDFVKQCMSERLSSVTSQYLTQYTVKGLYNFGTITKPDSSAEYKAFRESASQLHTYQNETCCSHILKEDNGLESLFKHIDIDVFRAKVQKVQANSDKRSATSRVLLEESAQKLRLLHDRFSQNITGFRWEQGQKSPPDECPDLECVGLLNSMECDFDKKEESEKPRSVQKNDRFGKLSMEMLYGYGFESADKALKITANLCLSRIFNILWLLPYHYPGFHSSYLYYGTTHSSFPVHVEDANTWSLNYLFIGHPKVWVIIPPRATDLLDFHLSKGGLSLDVTKCRNLLGHKTLLPTLNWLKDRTIPYKIVVQYPGDLVVLYPSAAHFGFNTGPNIAQAINIATISWIPWGINAKKCSCLPSQIHLDITPLVAAFRKDLLKYVLNGDVVVAPQILEGMKLLHDGVNRSCHVDMEPTQYNKLKQEMTAFKCPAKKCDKTFPQTASHSRKMAMIKHVNLVHKPIVQSSQLLHKTKELFKAWEGN